MNITTPTQEPIFAQDINLAVDIMTTLNKYELCNNMLIYLIVFKVLQKLLSLI